MTRKGGDVVNLQRASPKVEPNRVKSDAYKTAGVDTFEADAGVGDLIRVLRRTWPAEGLGRVVLPPDVRFFANVIDIDGIGIALCTDGVGSKAIVASLMGKYDTIGIDCVAMNVNDMICVGAQPVSMVDYLAIEEANAEMIREIGVGLSQGASQARISISGGETAELSETVNGFDLAGMSVGRVDLDEVLTGRDVADGDVVIGVASSGIHSNGLTLARKVLIEDGAGANGVDRWFDDLDCTVGEELLRPTDIYVVEALEILRDVSGVKALINITSEGLLNLTRIESSVSFNIEHLMEPPSAVFQLIQDLAKVSDGEMFKVFNMGIGFCYVVTSEAAEQTLAILDAHGRNAQRIGYASGDGRQLVRIPEKNLVGYRKTFSKDGGVARKVG